MDISAIEFFLRIIHSHGQYGILLLLIKEMREI